MTANALAIRRRRRGSAAGLLLLVLGPVLAAAADGDAKSAGWPCPAGLLTSFRVPAALPALRLEDMDLAPAVRSRPWWRDRFEAGGHLTTWSVDPILSLFAGDVTDQVAREIRSEVTGEISAGGHHPVSTGYENGLGLDSSGSNAGFGFRYYPAGEAGGFSVGFSFERTRLRLTLEGPVDVLFADGSRAEIRGRGAVETNPSSVQVDFRWEFSPGWRVSPYFALGLGLATFSGTVGYSYEGRYLLDGAEESVTGADSRTFHDLGAENEVHLPDRIPLLHLGMGVRARLVQGFGVNAEAGVWNGFMLRGGVFFRF